MWQKIRALFTGEFVPEHLEGDGEYLRIAVAGEGFGSRQSAIASLAKGEAVKLVREPRNRFDSNAIRIDARRGCIGYVPRGDAAVMAPVLDAGAKARAEVTSISRARPGYARDVWLNTWIERC